MLVNAQAARGRLCRPSRCSPAFTVPFRRAPQSQDRAAAVLGLPTQLVGSYETLTEALQSLEPVRWQSFDVVGARGNVRWIGAAFALFLIVLVVEALGRTAVGASGDSNNGLERTNDQTIESSLEAEARRQPTAIDVPLQLELERYLRESEKAVAIRESSISFAVIAWALFSFALEAFNRSPDLPLQP